MNHMYSFLLRLMLMEAYMYGITKSLYLKGGCVEVDREIPRLPNFKFRNVKSIRLNYSYIPHDSDLTNARCLVITNKPMEGHSYLTFYIEKFYGLFPKVNLCDLTGVAEVERESDDHYSELHKRSNLEEDAHYHFKFFSGLPRRKHYEQLHTDSCEGKTMDSFLKMVFNKSSLSEDIKDRYKDQLLISAHFFAEFPNEPGLIFEDGSFSENGGCNDTKNPESDLLHYRGPYRLCRLVEVERT